MPGPELGAGTDPPGAGAACPCHSQDKSAHHRTGWSGGYPQAWWGLSGQHLFTLGRQEGFGRRWCLPWDLADGEEGAAEEQREGRTSWAGGAARVRPGARESMEDSRGTPKMEGPEPSQEEGRRETIQKPEPVGGAGFSPRGQRITKSRGPSKS